MRMEITLAPESGRVNLAGILLELVKRANSGLIPVKFSNIDSVPFIESSVLSGTDFVKRLAVEKVETGRTRKMVLGFYMQSRLYMNDIKSAIGIKWLQQKESFFALNVCVDNFG